MFKIPEKAEEFSDGRLNAEVIPGGEFCGENDCGEKVANGLVEVAADATANSSEFFPENNSWLLPRLFPNSQSIYHTMSKPASWEDYWVPFAQKYGVVPFTISYATQRVFILGGGATERLEQANEITPEVVEGLDIRRSADTTSSIVLEEWGTNPVSINFAEFLQALQEGAVSGALTAAGNLLAFGVGEVATDIVVNQAYHQIPIEWANVQWLKGLSSQNRDALAEASRWIVEEQCNMVEEVNKERNGLKEPVPDGSAADEFGLNVHVLDDDELESWWGPIDAKENPELYTDLIDNTNELYEGDDILDYLYESGHESSVPDSPEDYTIDAWWDDYLDEI
jgi:TRAP-type C4-dicarboxylate transport system substrate-binding protein